MLRCFTSPCDVCATSRARGLIPKVLGKQCASGASGMSLGGGGSGTQLGLDRERGNPLHV